MHVADALDAARLFGPVIDKADRERIAVAFLRRDGAVIGIGDWEGEADEAELPIRSILAEALACGADALVVAHNHPSGDPEPSSADLAATRRLATAAGAVGLRLHDHLILADGRWRSVRAMGLL